ncbi:MAG TPA: TIM barrel protein [Candidatus Hydrogenedentes bacterium]|nr:TIM barrel protein [Candidatus Hydrogenedentota bacterium]HQK77379.1 TIM barrel protein [Candidatus Hydrogenedentota bacterium]
MEKLTRVFAAALACLLAQQFTFADEGSAARLAFFAFCMDTHDSQKRTLEQQAALLEELGYDGAGHLWLDNLEERIKTLDAHGLRLFQVYLQVNIAADANSPYDPRLKESLPLLRGRKTMLALLMSGAAPSDPALDERAVALVQEIADMANEAGVRVALYPHSGNWLEHVEDGLRIVQKAKRPNVGVMFNLCHWLKVDDEKNLKPLLTSAMPHLFAVSIHGADRAEEIHAGTGNWIQPLGNGSFDVGALLDTLRELGYQGPVGLQCYGIPGDARDHLTKSMTDWRRLMDARRP